jgi:hypothetical protein
MDPLAALGLAANILQFFEFAGKLLQETKEIFHSAKGATVENVELQDVAGKLSSLSATLLTPESDPQSRWFQYEKPIWVVATQCKAIAEELLTTIPSLKTNSSPNRKWRSFVEALRSVWNHDRIARLRERLNGMQSVLSTQLISLIRYAPRPDCARS